jgi:hypothetical protein
LQGYGRSDNCLLVVQHGRMAAAWKVLRAQVPDKPGNYIWTIRAPKARKWVPVYCGKAGGGTTDGTLKSRFKNYINERTFGPENEKLKFWAMVDAMSRGFSIEIR